MRWIFFLIVILTISCEEANLPAHALADKPQSKFLNSGTHGHTKSKVRSYYQVEVKPLNSAAGEVLLQADIMPHSTHPNTHVEWKLPRDMKPRRGSVHATFDAQAGVAGQFQILLDKDQLQEGDQIFVFVYHLIDETRYGLSQSYVYSTKINDESQPNSLDKSQKSPRFLQ